MRCTHRGQQRQRLVRRCRADLVLKHLLAAIERQQRSGAITGQIVQPHRSPMRGFGQRLQRQQLLCVSQRVVVAARSFGPLRRLDQRVAQARSAAAALLRQPGVELAAEQMRHLAEHAVRVEQVVAHARRDFQRLAADDEVPAELAPQVEQTLAQGIAGRDGLTARPQKLGQTSARCRTFERQPCQQRGVAWGQRRCRTVDSDSARRGSKLEVHGLAPTHANRRLAPWTRVARASPIGRRMTGCIERPVMKPL